jgi:hypothetical protein
MIYMQGFRNFDHKITAFFLFGQPMCSFIRNMFTKGPFLGKLSFINAPFNTYYMIGNRK